MNCLLRASRRGGWVFENLRHSAASAIAPALWRSDQYYWFTAVLAARGLQTVACRVVATCIVALGVVPMVLMASALGPQTAATRGLAKPLHMRGRHGRGPTCLLALLAWLLTWMIVQG